MATTSLSAEDATADLTTEAAVFAPHYRPPSVSQRLLEYATVALWMLIMLTIVHTLLSPRIAENDLRAAMDHTVNLPVASINMLANLLMAMLIAPRLRQVFTHFWAVRPFAIYTALVFLSVLWSISPGNTLRRGGYFVIDAFAAVYLGGRFTVKELGRFVVLGVLTLIALSVLAYLLNPSMVLDVSHPGEWMGVSEHKNVFGQFISLGMCFIALCDFGALWPLRLPALLLSTYMLWLSHSTTSWVVGALSLAAIPGLLLVRNARTVWRPMVSILCLLALLTFFLTGPLSASLLQMVGKDPTISGRTELWTALIGAILRRPLLGYGYGGFFSGSGEMTVLQSHSTWVAPSAHNGYLEVGLDLGLVGSCVAIWFLLDFLAIAIRYAQSVKTRSSLLPLVLLFYVLLHNCAEVSLLQAQALTPFVMYFLYVSMVSHQQLSSETH